uniref:DUF4704 domain-containing protein n=1 Tax=Ditylenchus dipsaci TaxID=166011 RepID=A0A915DUU0_9BILA
MDLIRLCKDCRENRRVILQMSVWQEWLISLAYMFLRLKRRRKYPVWCTTLFYSALSRYPTEYGGWRIAQRFVAFIEAVVEEWQDSSTAIVDHVNNSDNQVCTAPNSELEILDTTQQGLSILDAVHFLQRFVELADVFIFVSGINFNELEQEKNMPSGGILRQSLRLASTMAVRNILACRIAQKDDRSFFEISISSPTKYDAILKFVDNAMELKDPAKGITDPGRLLQNIDLQRLKGIIYRDMEEGRQAQFLALSVVYLLSVLMVSRYRDILEPPTSPSPSLIQTQTVLLERNQLIHPR